VCEDEIAKDSKFKFRFIDFVYSSKKKLKNRNLKFEYHEKRGENDEQIKIQIITHWTGLLFAICY
jgi:hypothetical protein